MRISLITAAATLLALLSACGGGGRATQPAGGSAGNPPLQQPAGDGQSVTLALSMSPVTEDLVKVTLSASGARRLYQMSLRLAYDPRAVRPLEVERGALIDQRAVFFAAPDKAAAREAAYVPIAFTYHPGEQIASGSGELLTARFEVLDASLEPGFSIVQSSDYLIARDPGGNPLQVLTGAGDE